MTLRFRFLTALLMVATLMVAVPALGQQEGETRLGGGSDISSQTAVPIPQGGSLPPVHYMFVDNPEQQPIRVRFQDETPPGVSVIPEWDEMTVPAEGTVKNHFAVTVGPEVAAGEYRIVVQLIRSDIEEQPGKVTNIPAVQAAFTLEVTGEAAALTVRSVSALAGNPVSGTLTLSAILSDGELFEMKRAEASTLEATVAPGEYRAAFLLGDRMIASEDVVVEADETREVVLNVETVSFVLVAVRPAEERGRLVVVDLIASVNNEVAPIGGPNLMQATVLHEGIEVDTATLLENDELPVGLTESTATYRPESGWQPGNYAFRFEMITPDFTLTSPQVPTLDVPPRGGFDLQAFFDTLGWREFIALAAVALLALILLERLLTWIFSLRRRR